MKKLLAFTVVVLMLNQMIMAAFAAQEGIDERPFLDIKGHWAEQIIHKHYTKQMLKGYPDGTFKPDNGMKRSELITLINNYYGLKKEAQTNFNDISGEEWYAQEAAKAKYYEYIGQDLINPHEVATRQDVVEMLSLIMDMEEQKSEEEGIELKDLEGLDENAKAKIKMFSELGYVKGYGDGTFRPKETITRSQVLAISENVLGYIVTNQDDLKNIPKGVKKVTIINPDLELNNLNIKGDLYVSPGVNGRLNIKNSKIEGQIIVSGGNAQNPIELENVQTEKIVLTKVKDKTGLRISGISQVGEIKTKVESQIDISGETVVSHVKTQTATNMSIGEGTKVQELTIEGKTQVETKAGSVIEVVHANSEAKIEGEGKIQKAYIKSPSVVIKNRPDYVEVDEKVDANIGGNDISSNNDDYNPDQEKQEVVTNPKTSNNTNNNRDNTSPEFIVAPSVVTGEEPGQIEITAKINESGNIYYVVVEVGSGEPSYPQIEKGEDSEGVKAVSSGSSLQYNSHIITLNPAQVYDVYFLAKDASSNRSNVKKVLSVKAKEEPLINHAPFAETDQMEVDEDNTVLIDVLANDIDEDGDLLTLISYTQGEHGTVIRDENTLIYTPDENYNGTDTFNYEISDGNGEASTGTVNIIINALNDNPVAKNDTAVTDENAEVSIDVLKNDYDADQDTLRIKEYTQGNHGTVSEDVYGLKYVPEENYYGVDSFTYTMEDNNGGEDTAEVNIIINSLNNDLKANNDNAELFEDGEVYIDVLANDTFEEGNQIEINSFTQGEYGQVVKVDDRLKYTPQADFFGTDSFIYTITGLNGGNDGATVAISVYAVNDIPVAMNDIASLGENGTILIDVLVNDTDIDGDTLSIAGFTQGTNGAVAQEGDSLRYTPDANYNGADSFTYEISDGNGGVATATVNVTVNTVNDAPVAINDSATLNEDGTVLIDVLVNDTDIEGDTLSITGFTQGTNGTVAQEGDSLRYTPDANYNGADSFTYEISDGNGGVSTATVNVTVNAVNDIPVATNDTATLNEDITVLIDVLVNDTDIDGDTLSITGFTQGTNGTVAQEGDSLRYTPDANYNGADSFMYEISDGNGGVATATVNVTVNAVNDVPVATNDTATLNEDGTALIDVFVNDTDIDGDTSSITGFTQGTNGTVAQEGDSLRYTPDANYNGADSFTYEISDGNGGVSTATVNVTVNAVNDVPVATNDTATLNEDVTVLIDVLVNDTDIDGDTLSITGFTQGTNGAVAQEGDSLRYTPDANYNGADSFTYEISDGNGGVSTATVNVTVNAVNDVPVATNDTATLNEDVTALIDVLVNDTDIDGDTLSITGFTQGTNGTVTQEGDSLRYTPDANYNGADSFMYEISDGNGGVATATVNVTVNAINDAPVAINDAAPVDQDSTVLIDVLVNDTDIDGDTLSITGFTQGTNGMVAQEGDSLRYTPNAGYSGADSFTYDINDGNGGVATATVNVTINSISLISMNIEELDGATDYIEFTVTLAGNYEIKTSFYLQACDTAVYVYDSAYNLIGSNDDYVDLYGCVITSLNPGTYYVKVDDFDLATLYCHLEVNKL